MNLGNGHGQQNTISNMNSIALKSNLQLNVVHSSYQNFMDALLFEPYLCTICNFAPISQKSICCIGCFFCFEKEKKITIIYKQINWSKYRYLKGQNENKNDAHLNRDFNLWFNLVRRRCQTWWLKLITAMLYALACIV